MTEGFARPRSGRLGPHECPVTPHSAPGAAAGHALRRANRRRALRPPAAAGRGDPHGRDGHVYGAQADLAVGRALAGLPRDSFALVGAVGHDFYGTQRDGAKGFPRFTALRSARASTGSHPAGRRRAQPRALRGGTRSMSSPCTPRSRRLHIARRLGGDGRPARGGPVPLPSASLPGPANGFTLDVIGCLERFGAPDRLGDADPQPAGALAGPAGIAGLRAPRRARAGARGRLRRAVPRRCARRGLAGREATTADTARRAGSMPGGAARRAAADRRSPWPDDAAALLRLDTGPAGRRLRRADADPGSRAEGEAGRGQARRACRGAARGRAGCRGAGCHRRDRRQHGLHGAQGRLSAYEGEERPDAWPLDDELREVGGGSGSKRSAISSARRNRLQPRLLR